MKKILFLADLHLSPVSPGSRTDDYTEASFAKLEQVRSLIERLEVDALVILGDIFHLKSWSKNPYWLTNRFVEWLFTVDQLGCEIVVVVGNHDVPYGNTEFIRKQPIGTILAQPFVKRSLILNDPYIKIDVHDFDPAFVKDDLNQYKRDGAKFHIICAHNALMERGQLPGEPTVNFHEFDLDCDVLAFGHIHHPTVIQKVNDIWFINPGAMMRGSLAKENLKREINVVLMRFDEDIKYKKFALDVAPSEQVFDLVKKEREDTRDDKIADFVDMLDTASKATLSTDPSAILDDMDVARSIKKVAQIYLDGGQLDILS